jgi:hypothetical protein
MEAPTLNIPPRAANALTGTQFIDSIIDIPFDGGEDAQRETCYLDQFLDGNVPDFMRTLCPVEVGDLLIYVTPDYLCIGVDYDYVRIPMNPITAQTIANHYNASLITPMMTDAVDQAAEIKLPFRAQTPQQGFEYDHSMMFTDRYVIHNKWIEKDLKAAGASRGQLASGHKKDVVLDPWLETVNWEKVGVYLKSVGHTYRTHSHEVTYKDYSHGVRLAFLWAYQHDAMWLPIESILMHAEHHKKLSKRGRFKSARYPVLDTFGT